MKHNLSVIAMSLTLMWGAAQTRVAEPIVDDLTLIARTDTGFNPLYSNGGQDTGVLGKSYGADIGITYAVLSLDAVYENEKEAVNLRSSFDDVPTPLPTPGLAAHIANDTSYNLMAKDVFEFGDSAQKDELTVYGGYSHIQKAHGNYIVGSAQDNYPISVRININDAAVYNMEWLGARYAMSSGWNFVGAFYHITQNSWTTGLGTNGNDNLGCVAAGLLCAGSFKDVSGVADYIINKHYDMYGGVNWSEFPDGLANEFPLPLSERREVKTKRPSCGAFA